MGKFIVLEGCEGGGKSTAIATVHNFLVAQGIAEDKIIHTREPGGTPIAEKIRTILKENDPTDKMAVKTELLLMYAARAQLVETVIKPALANDCYVIGDRHDLSSLAYQGSGRGIDKQLIAEIRSIVLGDFKPDITIILDLPPEVGLARAHRRGTLDRFELEDINFFNRIRNCFLEEATRQPNMFVVDASAPLSVVSDSICQVLRSQLCIAG